MRILTNQNRHTADYIVNLPAVSTGRPLLSGATATLRPQAPSRASHTLPSLSIKSSITLAAEHTPSMRSVLVLQWCILQVVAWIRCIFLTDKHPVQGSERSDIAEPEPDRGRREHGDGWPRQFPLPRVGYRTGRRLSYSFQDG